MHLTQVSDLQDGPPPIIEVIEDAMTDAWDEVACAKHDTFMKRHSLCLKHTMEGWCRWGDECHYRHDVQGLLMKHISEDGDRWWDLWLDGSLANSVTDICSRWAKYGECQHAASCVLKHICAPRDKNGDAFCRHYLKHRTCDYGDNCRHKHVISHELIDIRDEVKPKAMPSKAKTMPSKSSEAKGNAAKGNAAKVKKEKQLDKRGPKISEAVKRKDEEQGAEERLSQNKKRRLSKNGGETIETEEKSQFEGETSGTEEKSQFQGETSGTEHEQPDDEMKDEDWERALGLHFPWLRPTPGCSQSL